MDMSDCNQPKKCDVISVQTIVIAGCESLILISLHIKALESTIWGTQESQSSIVLTKQVKHNINDLSRCWWSQIDFPLLSFKLAAGCHFLFIVFMNIWQTRTAF